MLDGVLLDAPRFVAFRLEGRELRAHLGDMLKVATARIFELAAQFEVRDPGPARLEEVGFVRNFRHVDYESIDAIDLPRQPQYRLARRFRGGMLGRLREKTLKVVERGLEAFEALVQRATLHQLFQRTRVEQQNAIERRQRARRIAILEIDQFQIAENANQDVPDPDWLKVRRRHLDRLSIDLGQARANFLQRQDGAFGERVDNELAAFVDRLDQKMGRETDPVEIEAEPFADFQIKH